MEKISSRRRVRLNRYTPAASHWAIHFGSSPSSAGFSGNAMRKVYLNSRARVGVDEIDDLLHRRAGKEDAFDADGGEFGNVDVRNDSANHDEHIVEPLLLEEIHETRRDVIVGAGEDRQADDVGVLLQRGRHDLLGGLAKTRVDDFHPSIAQRPGNDLGAAVVTIETGLGNDDSELTHLRSVASDQLSVWLLPTGN